MVASSNVLCFGAVLLSALLAGCADMKVLGRLGDELGIGSGPSEEYLAEKCPGWKVDTVWAKQCRVWRNERDAEENARRKSEADARQAARAAVEMDAYRVQQEQQERKQREAQELERAAVQADERAGYKHVSFEDFALDAAKMQGAKVALYGVYVGKGQRLASNQLAALMWTEVRKSSQVP